MRKVARLLSFEHPSFPHELGRKYLDAPISHLPISKTGHWEGITIKEQHDRQPYRWCYTDNATVSSLMPHRHIVNFNRPALCHRWLSVFFPSIMAPDLCQCIVYPFLCSLFLPFHHFRPRLFGCLHPCSDRGWGCLGWPCGHRTISGFTVCMRGMKILINEVKETHQLLNRLNEII